jgi:hypothetical protein
MLPQLIYDHPGRSPSLLISSLNCPNPPPSPCCCACAW